MTDYPFLKDLNEEQLAAVTTTEGPVLVLSGAGTGKTRVLTTRIAYILASALARPWEVLAVTFTNKAAKEMKERLKTMIGGAANDVWLGTFHAIGLRILSKYGHFVGLKKDFIILNADDQERLIKQLMKSLGLDTKKWNPAVVADIINRWKDKGLMPDEITAALSVDYCDGAVMSLYGLYQTRLHELNAVDFGDLLLLPLVLFKKEPAILDEYQHKFKYLLVDEYQDTNVVQYLLLRLLAKKHHNICCVGDDDQSIYSWRGAEVENILKFNQDFEKATIIRLEQNYRSTEHILGAASALIAHNTGRLGKTLRVAKGRMCTGDKIKIKSFFNGYDEANHIVDLIENRQRAGEKLSDMAILVRAGFQTREFEDILIRAGIPYKVIGGFKFYEREEIRDAVAYLRLVLNPDDDLAFVRIVNKPKRGIGDGALDALRASAREHHISLFDAIAWASLRPSVRAVLDGFQKQIRSYRDEMASLKPAELAKNMLRGMGYMAMWQSDKKDDGEARLENINELFNVLSGFDTVAEFIAYASLVMEADETVSDDQLLVMTLHASKGLEFKDVFLPGWEEGIFPHQRALDEAGESGLEEERRLAYVGITRAKERLFISYAFNRRLYGQWQSSMASRFLEELPAEHIEKLDAPRHQSDILGFSWQRQSQEYKPAVKSRRVGKQVHHEVFGDGVVVRDEGDKVEVIFAEHGLKKVLAKFLEMV